MIRWIMEVLSQGFRGQKPYRLLLAYVLTVLVAIVAAGGLTGSVDVFGGICELGFPTM